MASPDELVKRVREIARQIRHAKTAKTIANAADAIEQQARELAVLRASGMYLANQALRLIAERDAARIELTRHKHVTDTLMAAWPKGVPMPEWEEPDTRGTDIPEHGGMSG